MGGWKLDSAAREELSAERTRHARESLPVTIGDRERLHRELRSHLDSVDRIVAAHVSRRLAGSCGVTGP